MSALGTQTTPVTPPGRSRPPTPGRERRRRRFAGGVAPYALLAPAAAVLLGVLAYPLYTMATLAFQKKGVGEMYRGDTVWIGLKNFRTLFDDDQFWQVVVRTVVFTAVNVGLTMVLSLLIALLLRELGPRMRTLLTLTLVAVWAMPVLVTVTIFKWMTDFQYGIVNYALDKLPGVHMLGHNWFEDPVQGLGVVTATVVWGAIPFAAITLYAGLTQVPRELVEAAQIDGAGSWQVFRNVTVAVLKPVLIVVTSLEVIWDFQVFAQVYLMLDGRPGPGYQVMATYVFQESFGISQYGLGSAAAVVMVAIMMVLTVFYVRTVVKSGDVE